MSDNNNLLIGVAAIGLYLYLKNQRAMQPAQGYAQGVPSMPGNVGTGSNQVGTGALVGFLQAIAGTFNGGQVQPNAPPSNFGAIQDSASSSWDAMTEWANSGTVGDYGDYGYDDTVRNELF